MQNIFKNIKFEEKKTCVSDMLFRFWLSSLMLPINERVFLRCSMFFFFHYNFLKFHFPTERFWFEEFLSFLSFFLNYFVKKHTLISAWAKKSSSAWSAIKIHFQPWNFKNEHSFSQIKALSKIILLNLFHPF